MPPPRVPERKLERWTQRWDTIENLAAAVNDAVPTILTASAHPATDPYPDNTLGEGNHAGGPSDPTGRHAEQHAGGTTCSTATGCPSTTCSRCSSFLTTATRSLTG